MVRNSNQIKKVLIGGFYRPPNSNTGYMDLIKESIDRAYNTNIVDIIITGDFNFNMMSNNLNKLKELILEYNLNQLITDPTHFTETSSSLIDLILVRNQANILCSMVADPFVPNQVRYHCPATDQENETVFCTSSSQVDLGNIYSSCPL